MNVGLLVVCAALLGPVNSSQPVVSVRTLLREMIRLDHLTQRPNPVYSAAQASSYDRASVDPNTNWFANADYGQYIRDESRDGRVEHVMADLIGPGAVMRFWSANPNGVVRFYFDGESTPRIEAKLEGLLTGNVAPWGDPYAYVSARGANLYFPFPYARSLKITVDDTGRNAKGLYYQIGYRTYAPGTAVETYDPAREPELKEPMAFVARSLLASSVVTGKADSVLTRKPSERKVTVRPGGQAVLFESREGRSGRAIDQFRVRVAGLLSPAKDAALPWRDPRRNHAVLRSVRLLADFDGIRCVDVPFGDFFGSAPGLNPYKSFPFEVTQNGEFICRLPMRWKRSAKIWVRNDGGVPFVATASARAANWPWTDEAYHFKAQWSVDRGSTRPMRDMRMLEARGEGMFVGSNLQVTNPTEAWWGEGDEKIYVDGEAFPSTFGTGTEDYYGYAWCSNEPFVRPYHAQPRCDGPGNRGQTSIARFHVADPIPFETLFKFDMEMWHWAEVEATFARTVYWYAKPGGPAPKSPDGKLLMPIEIKGPEGVKGAIEGETMRIVSISGGVTEKQGGFAGLSLGRQLWWRDAKAGDRLVLQFECPKAGRYVIVGNFCHARDYGIHRITIERQTVEPIDFFGELTWKKLSLGTFTLPKGPVTMQVEVVGTHPGAEPRQMFGLDYLLLEPVK
ncbi:MAG TPA: DUF2961 domain-containing protein [Fimbriimonadaceae bacterium]|mgnify:CR=1 FL=1|nr:DUF2961 domain-containing protein [Fimbriimonadaceae bacterium]